MSASASYACNAPKTQSNDAMVPLATPKTHPRPEALSARQPPLGHLSAARGSSLDRLTDPCQRFQLGSIPSEMFCPSVASRMEEANNFSAVRIDPSDVRSLEAIAMDTSEGEILKFCFAPVLPCNDVIYLEGCWVKC